MFEKQFFLQNIGIHDYLEIFLTQFPPPPRKPSEGTNGHFVAGLLIIYSQTFSIVAHVNSVLKISKFVFYRVRVLSVGYLNCYRTHRNSL